MVSTSPRGVLKKDVIVHPVVAALTRRRMLMGMTRAGLATRAGVSRDMLDRLETGKNPQIGLENLTRILGALGMFLDVSFYTEEQK
jgi:transcriptional regulator with XRE-family HTH domain